VAEIRVLLIGLPPMLRELVRQAASSVADIELVGEISAAEPAGEAVKRYQPSVVLLTSDHLDLRGDWPSLLRQGSCELRLIALESGGDAGAVFELRPRRLTLGELSPGALIEAIRTTPTDGA
jgi:DNA-binding NarL/FixJ family response regulator